MSEFVWYSRLVVWAGALVLLAQAVAGRGTSFVTVFGIVCLSGGFVAFLGGLAISGRASMPVLPSKAQAASPAPVAEQELTEQEAAGEVRPAAPANSLPAHQLTGDPEYRKVRTRTVTEDGFEYGELCPYCGRQLRAGEVAAQCYRCKSVQHAACWTENQDRCATPGCEGHGRLELNP